MNDQKLLNSLMDFSDLRRKNDDFQLHTSKQNEEDYNVTADEAIMKSFKELREKLKLSIKENNNLKEDIKVQNIKTKQSQQNLEDALQSNFELKDKVNSLSHTNEDLKKKIMMMKESLEKQKSLEEDLQFTKSTLLQVKLQRDELMNNREKLVELSIEEKMGMEEEINKLKAKSKSDDQYIATLEGDFSKCRQKIMKLENQIKKMSIAHDEQTFSNHWARQNFETQHLQQIIKDLEKEIQNLKAKNKKEKERKQLLEERIIELEQFSGLNNVKAETYCGEIEVVHKKYLKSEKKLNEFKGKLDKIKDQKLNLQEKFNKLLFLGQELVGKVKRQSSLQLNQAIREYELGFKKLKQGEIQTSSLALQETQKTNVLSGVSSQKLLLEENFNSQSTEPLYRKAIFYDAAQTEDNRNYSRKESASSAPKKSYEDSRMTFGEREENQWNENNAIENRIRREREEMERKLKEKLLCRRIQTTASSEHYKLRNDYIRSYVDKRY